MAEDFRASENLALKDAVNLGLGAFFDTDHVQVDATIIGETMSGHSQSPLALDGLQGEIAATKIARRLF